MTRHYSSPVRGTLVTSYKRTSRDRLACVAGVIGEGEGEGERGRREKMSGIGESVC